MAKTPEETAEWLHRITLDGYGDGFLEAADVIRSLQSKLDSCRRDAIQECWNAINTHIPRGTLASIYENESRNGMVLATNILFQLLHPEPPK